MNEYVVVWWLYSITDTLWVTVQGDLSPSLMEMCTFKLAMHLHVHQTNPQLVLYTG